MSSMLRVEHEYLHFLHVEYAIISAHLAQGWHQSRICWSSQDPCKHTATTQTSDADLQLHCNLLGLDDMTSPILRDSAVLHAHSSLPEVRVALG